MTKVVKIGEKYVSETVLRKAQSGNPAAIHILSSQGISVKESGEIVKIPTGEVIERIKPLDKPVFEKATFEAGKEVPVSAGVAAKLGLISKEEAEKNKEAIYIVRKNEIPTTINKNISFIESTLPKPTSATATTASQTVKIESPELSKTDEYILKAAPYVGIGALSVLVPPVGIAVAGYTAYVLGKGLGTAVGKSLREKKPEYVTEFGKEIVVSMKEPENIGFLVGSIGTGMVKSIKSPKINVVFQKTDIIELGKKEGLFRLTGEIVAVGKKETKKIGKVEVVGEIKRVNKNDFLLKGYKIIQTVDNKFFDSQFYTHSKRILSESKTDTYVSKTIEFKETFKLSFTHDIYGMKTMTIERFIEEPKPSYSVGKAKEIVRFKFDEPQVGKFLDKEFKYVEKARYIDVGMAGKTVSVGHTDVFKVKKTQTPANQYSAVLSTVKSNVIKDVMEKPLVETQTPVNIKTTLFEPKTNIKSAIKKDIKILTLTKESNLIKQTQKQELRLIRLSTSQPSNLLKSETLPLHGQKTPINQQMTMTQKQNLLSKIKNVLEMKNIIGLKKQTKTLTLPQTNVVNLLRTHGIFGIYNNKFLRKINKKKVKPFMKDVIPLADPIEWSKTLKFPVYKSPTKREKSLFLFKTLTTGRFPYQKRR
ncbi:MAG: hypothetical protein QXG39_02540 [Candidatus Aenigmatarchaeota archaeon]